MATIPMLFRAVALLLASLLAWASYAQQPAAEPKTFLWQVTGSGGTAYLFGTIHLGKPEFYPLPKPVEAAFAKSDVLAVEADLTKVGNDPAELARMGMYPPPDRLEKHISKELLGNVLEAAARYNLQMERTVPLKPWVLASLFVMAESMRAGYDPAKGVDAYLISQAKAKGKPVIELESVDFQLKLMEGLSPAEQEAFLQGTLLSLKDRQFKRTLDALEAAWKAGDSKRLEEAAEESQRGLPMAAVLNDKIVHSRNPALVNKVEQLIASGKIPFVAVGALHLTGSRGMLKLLADKGYQLKQQ